LYFFRSPKATDCGRDYGIGHILTGVQLLLNIDVIVYAALDEERVVVALVNQPLNEFNFELQRLSETLHRRLPKQCDTLGAQLMHDRTEVSDLRRRPGVWLKAGRLGTPMKLKKLQ
jgi:hypothetical protein